VSFGDIYREFLIAAQKAVINSLLDNGEVIVDMGAAFDANMAKTLNLSGRSPLANGFLVVTNKRLFHVSDLKEKGFEVQIADVVGVRKGFHIAPGTSVLRIESVGSKVIQSFYCSKPYVESLVSYFRDR
jgi:hypothetical protein